METVMLSWKPCGITEMGGVFEGSIDGFGEERFAMHLYRDAGGRYYTWYWGMSACTPLIFINALNEFIASSRPPFAAHEGRVLLLGDTYKYPGIRVAMPLHCKHQFFFLRRPVQYIDSLRIDIPGPGPRPKATELSSGQTATVPPIGVCGVSFLGLFAEKHTEVHLACIASFTPADAIATFYARTVGIPISAEDRRQLVALIDEHSRSPHPP